MEIGQVIGGRYLLQRLIQQGQFSTVYQGIDQSFQRLVAVKSVSAAYMPLYREAVRKTAQFSFPNIVTLYDLVIEPERLYLIEEYIEGDTFHTLLQAPLHPYDVADYGRQICSALLYASGSSSHICHGDLTPSAILRDRRGLIRVNNFALPSDVQYFTAWSAVGGEGIAISDRDLAWGVMSPGRLADDTRAAGLLLYQLLAGRPPNTPVVEPPIDGRLRFMRNVPPELCDLVARTIIRGHPQYINTVETLYDELNVLADALELSASPPAPVPAYQPAEVGQPRQFSPTGASAPGGKGLNPPLPAGQPGSGLASYQQEKGVKLASPSMNPLPPAAPTVADASLLPITGRPANNYPNAAEKQEPESRSPLIWLLLLGLLAFILFFVIGYFAGNLLVHP